MNPHESSSAAPPFDRLSPAVVTLDGRSCVSFAGCNYLGLAQDPRVLEAAHEALGRLGLSTSASRQTSGNTSEHDALERDLSAFLAFEGALLTPDGYTANLAAAQALARDHRIALLDERAHQSLRDAARVAGMPIATYAHLDPLDAARQLRELGPQGVVIMTDGVFATDGSIAPLTQLLDAMPEAGCTLLVDDCHGFSVLGRHGRGTLNHLGLADPRVRLTTTLAKGLGCSGGIVCGPSTWTEFARRSSSAAVCTTPAPPPSVAAARCALRLIQHEPLRFDRLRRNVQLTRDALRCAHFEAHEHPIPVFAIWRPDEAQTRALAQGLHDRGIFIPASVYPGGPAPVYLRISVTAEHTPEQIQRLGSALHEICDPSSIHEARTA